MNKVSSYYLSDNPTMTEIQRDNNFDFIVTDIDNIVRVDAKETSNNKTITNAQDVLHFSVVSFTVPNFNQEVIQINYGNSAIKAAGKASFNDGTLVVNDYIGADTKSALMAWQNLSYNIQNDTIGRMSNYKKTCYLQELTPDLKLVRTWKLMGCWVSSLQEDQFSFDSAGKKTITATITFDRAYMELPDEEIESI